MGWHASNRPFCWVKPHPCRPFSTFSYGACPRLGPWMVRWGFHRRACAGRCQTMAFFGPPPSASGAPASDPILGAEQRFKCSVCTAHLTASTYKTAQDPIWSRASTTVLACARPTTSRTSFCKRCVRQVPRSVGHSSKRPVLFVATSLKWFDTTKSQTKMEHIC